MKTIRNASVVLARFFLSAIFLSSAISQLFHWHDMEQLLMNVLCDWQTNLWFSDEAQSVFGFLIPWTPLLLILATLLQVTGGFLLLLGVKEELGAGLLILFLIPTTILMHSFWFMEGSARELQTIMFLKNLAILGGLILVCLNGAKSKGGSDPFTSIRMG